MLTLLLAQNVEILYFVRLDMDNQKVFWVNARAIIERTENGKKEIIIQWRNKNNDECWEFPGGQIEMYESLYTALKREVKEETGLDITVVNGENGYFQENSVECIKPFSVYQQLKGTFGNSVGFHFICHAVGKLLIEGDQTKNIKWIGLNELKQILENEKFLGIDKVAAMLYLKENNFHE